MPKGYMLQSDTAGTDGHPSLLATITGIDMKSQAATSLLLVPTGKTLVVMDIILRVTAVSVFATPATVAAGKTAAFNEWLTASALTGFSTVGSTISLATMSTAAVRNVFAAGETFSLNVTIGAGATTLTATAYLIGILV